MSEVPPPSRAVCAAPGSARRRRGPSARGTSVCAGGGTPSTRLGNRRWRGPRRYRHVSFLNHGRQTRDSPPRRLESPSQTRAHRHQTPGLISGTSCPFSEHRVARRTFTPAFFSHASMSSGKTGVPGSSGTPLRRGISMSTPRVISRSWRSIPICTHRTDVTSLSAVIGHPRYLAQRPCDCASCRNARQSDFAWTDSKGQGLSAAFQDVVAQRHRNAALDEPAAFPLGVGDEVQVPRVVLSPPSQFDTCLNISSNSADSRRAGRRWVLLRRPEQVRAQRRSPSAYKKSSPDVHTPSKVPHAGARKPQKGSKSATPPTCCSDPAPGWR